MNSKFSCWRSKALWAGSLACFFLGLSFGCVLTAQTLVPADGDKPGSFYFEMVPVASASFYVARFEVTQAQYEEITGENPSNYRTPKAPVNSVSWEDAELFCKKLTARERQAGRLPKGWLYDLPTDAQWDQFAVGTEVVGAVTSIEKAREHAEPVGGGKPNPLGLSDVVGNVWEWCLDWYDNRIRRRDANPDMPYVLTDAEAAARGPEETFKVLRGGAWDTGAADGFVLGSRLRYAPSMGNRRTGFRCVVEPEYANPER